MLSQEHRNVACSIKKYCTKSDSRQQLAKKFYSTTICEKIFCTIICTRIRTLKMLSVDCGPILLQLFSWESHETSTIPPNRIFQEGHCMICSFFCGRVGATCSLIPNLGVNPSRVVVRVSNVVLLFTM